MWNGILAQQHPDTGMISYFLPLQAGAVKIWGTPTEDFWCCHGSMVQAQTMYENNIFYSDPDGLVVSQMIPSELDWRWDGSDVSVRIEPDPQLEETHHPHSSAYWIKVNSARPEEFTLKIRLPLVDQRHAGDHDNGEPHPVACAPSSYVELRRAWGQDEIHVKLPKKLSAVPLPDEPDTYAFMEGPVVLAGLNPGGDALARTLRPVAELITGPSAIPSTA